MSRLHLEGITKRYGAAGVLVDVNLDVEDGEFVAILGPSGCGKSTLLRIVAGLVEQTSGRVTIGERDVSLLPPARRGIAMVFQSYALYPHLTVEGNLTLGLRQARTPAPLIAERVAEAARILELGPLLERRPAQLSGGQRQRVAIARSLVLEPTLLLLDEPLGALDLKLREHMKLELKQLQSAFGTTFVYITHDQSEALVMSDHVGVMNHGRFEQLGTPQELYYAPASAFVAGFVGANNRIAGQVLGVEGPLAELGTSEGFRVRARAHGALTAGVPAEVFVRPEAMTLARTAAELPAGQSSHAGEVTGMLFDGANSSVLLREQRSRLELRIALPQTGAFADLRPGAQISFSFDPERAVCFPAGASHA
jgi:spermidine/putrescine transport system ATP-binding protein